MENQDDYLKRLIQRAEELMETQVTKSTQGPNDNLSKLPAPQTEAPPKGTKQKRFYSEEQKQKLRERLELAREKSKEVRALKKNINDIKSNEKKEEKEEKKAKFNEQSLEDKMQKIKQLRQYNPPPEGKEIQGPKVEKPAAPQSMPEQVPLKLSSQVQEPQPAQPAQPAPAPVPNRPKYFLPTMKYATKHKFNNIL